MKVDFGVVGVRLVVVRGSTREAYEDFYKRLAFQIKDKKVKPANIANNALNAG
ncbi:hypothetical protein B0T26DRAFT_756952 [Lasiosphaeria miniovina]|uniref:Uncharacterized protein n=1 Tax=Lasiosphaeria miniovina TaxID=1954250 RepID=A0AA39ZTP3_9PEZI|nr:uncharacterized protein B0T26DRAFT_756952 [Lasiosphaeria miniovina]KAK0703391.1 hypothetical protein B0T26DRAFT_756952 [Lasiosphaeria miniovina]